MKSTCRLRRFLLLCLLPMLCVPLPAIAQDDTVIWWGHTLTVEALSVDPAHVQGNDEPETVQFVMVHFAADEPIDALLLGQELATLRLVDEDGEEYPAAAYLPDAMVYSARNGVFVTASRQPSFEALFVLPRAVALSACTLRASMDRRTDAELPLADIPVHEAPVREVE